MRVHPRLVAVPIPDVASLCLCRDGGINYNVPFIRYWSNSCLSPIQRCSLTGLWRSIVIITWLIHNQDCWSLYNSRSAVLIRRYVSRGGWKFIQIQILIWCMMLHFCRNCAHFRTISYGHEHTPHLVQYQAVCIVLPVWHIKLENYNFIWTLACTSLPV
jgi:hypothetical protein